MNGRKKYKKYENYSQPRIVSVKVDVNLFPKTLDADASGTYVMVNKTSNVIDSLFLNHNVVLLAPLSLIKKLILSLEDTLYNFRSLYRLKQALYPGDSIKFIFYGKKQT